MNRSLWARLKQSVNAAEQWYRRTPERAISEAYEAAKAITQIESQYSGGQTIDLMGQGEGAVSTYFQTQIKKHLKTIRVRLTEYRFCTPVIEPAPRRRTGQTTSMPNLPPWDTPVSGPTDVLNSDYAISGYQYLDVSDATVDFSQEMLDKLKFIDSVLLRYEPWRSPPSPAPANPLSTDSPLKPLKLSNSSEQKPSALRSVQDSFYNFSSGPGPSNNRKPGRLEGNSFIPRSILETADRFRRELDSTPQTEEEVVQNFRLARSRTRSATRFLLLLIILPLLTQQVSKALVVGPIVDRMQGAEQVEAWVNPRLEQKVLAELTTFEEKLKFQSLLSGTPRSAPEIEIALKEKAVELQNTFQRELKVPIKNIFADLISLFVFSVLVITGRQEIATLKAFIDEIVYGLSDSAKAFIIILLTDVFVGFHSPHGWEVLVESVLDHFGLPLNRGFVNMFIATFPVMLDTVFKYWIFRYLNQISPSAVATYKNMNE